MRSKSVTSLVVLNINQHNHASLPLLPEKQDKPKCTALSNLLVEHLGKHCWDKVTFELSVPKILFGVM